MIEWNKVIYADCMNEENGLPTLPDKSVDLCITDPPYNVNLKGNSQKNHNNKKWKTDNRVDYNDNIKDYKNWCISWFNELKRVCKTIIFTPGYTNLKMWFEIEEPYGMLYHFKPNGRGYTSISTMNKTEIILYYGDCKKRFISNTFNIYLKNGFLRECSLIHPCPKSKKLWNKIIKRIDPKSIIDPFLGSGTTAEVATKLGIKWLGYEINEVYSQDINKRLKNCKREPKQVTII